jgi:hypothetical protein
MTNNPKPLMINGDPMAIGHGGFAVKAIQDVVGKASMYELEAPVEFTFDSLLYSVITFKATRKPQLAHSGLSKLAAIEAATRLYEAGKVMGDHGFMASGVSVMMATDKEAEQFVLDERLPHGFKSEFQCGGW